MMLACMSSMVLLAFVWITSTFYLIYFFVLISYCIMHSKPHFNIWNTSIVDHPWTPKPSHSHAPSIDSRRTLADVVNPYNLKAGTSRDDLSEMEKDGESVLPVYTITGPPTFGATERRGGLDIGASHGYQQGVNSINGAPVYPTQSYEQGHKFYKNPRGGDVESQTRNAQAPWVNSTGEETPSPAIITHASRVAQPSMSLYPVHVVNAGLTTQSAGKSPGRMSGLLRAAGLNQSATSLPYLSSTVGHGGPSDTTSIISSHSKSQSVDSFTQPPPRLNASNGGRRSTSEVRERERGRSSRPRHRPPPLDLSSLSNIANADRR